MNYQTMPTGQLVQLYREVLLALGANPNNNMMSRKSDLIEEEILRRMAW